MTLSKVNQDDFERIVLGHMWLDGVPGQTDMWRSIAAQCFDVPYAEVTDHQRGAAKQAGWFLMYLDKQPSREHVIAFVRQRLGNSLQTG